MIAISYMYQAWLSCRVSANWVVKIFAIYYVKLSFLFYLSWTEYDARSTLKWARERYYSSSLCTFTFSDTSRARYWPYPLFQVKAKRTAPYSILSYNWMYPYAHFVKKCDAMLSLNVEPTWAHEIFVSLRHFRFASVEAPDGELLPGRMICFSAYHLCLLV